MPASLRFAMNAFSAAVLMITMTCSRTLAGENAEAPAPPSTLASRAEHLVANASGAAEAARRWLAEEVSHEKLEGLADRARARAEESWHAALARARAAYQQSLGLRRFQSPRVPGEPGLWTACSAGECAPERVVLLVHGLDEPGDVWEDLAPELARAGHAVLRFDYANDQPIARSATDLLDALAELRTTRGVHRLAIVCHSMGGLVARDALTREESYAGKPVAESDLPEIERLVLIAAPNDGAPLACLRIFAEAREQLARFLASGARQPEALLGFTADGDGEAGHDLCPDSSFLAELNAREPFSPELAARTTNIVAEFRPLDRAEVLAATDCALAHELLTDADRAALRDACLSFILNIGDGVVPDTSSALPGIADEVRVNANHRSVVRRVPVQTALLSFLGQPMGEPAAIAVVLDRLSEHPTGFGRAR